MNFKVNINRVFDKGNLKGFATLIIEEKIYITGFKIIEKDGKLYTFYGSRKDKKGKYQNIYFIADKDLRNQVYETVLLEYQKYMDRC
ncbi:MAG: SpoVG family protein [Eubacteriales bacterium]|nr:SpoVG family protein [Eubacteriales bacterium]